MTLQISHACFFPLRLRVIDRFGRASRYAGLFDNLTTLVKLPDFHISGKIKLTISASIHEITNH